MSVRVGNAGEHFVMSCLLAQDIDAGLADRGNPKFDILVRTQSGEFRALRVKTTTDFTFQWTAKEKWRPLPGFDPENPDPRDITILVAFHGELPGPKTEVYVIPTARLVADINHCHKHYHSHSNLDGTKRKDGGHRAIRLTGTKKPDNISYGYCEDWAEFQGAWHLLSQ